MKINLMKGYQIPTDEKGIPPINIREMIMKQLHSQCLQAAENLISYVLAHQYGLGLEEAKPRLVEIKYESNPEMVDYFLQPTGEPIKILPDKLPPDWQWVASLWWNFSEVKTEDVPPYTTTATVSFDYDTPLGDNIDEAQIMH